MARTTYPLPQVGSSQMLPSASVDKAIQSRLWADKRIPFRHFLHSTLLLFPSVVGSKTFNSEVYVITLPVYGSLSFMLLPPFPNNFTLSDRFQANWTIGYQRKAFSRLQKNRQRERRFYSEERAAVCMSLPLGIRDSRHKPWLCKTSMPLNAAACATFWQSCPQKHSVLWLFIWWKWVGHQNRKSKSVVNCMAFSHLEKLAASKITMPSSYLLESGQSLGKKLLGKGSE